MRIERQPEVDEDLRADAVVAQVGGQAELEVGVDGVEPLLLELVGLELVEQADAAPLLGEVEQHALALALDHRQRRLELLAAVAAQRVEDVAGQALGVHADEHVVLARDVALDQRDVVLVVDQRAVADRGEVAEVGRQPGVDDALDELVVAAPVGDQVGDRDHLQPVLVAVGGEVGDARHRAVLVLISQITPAGISPARRARSTAASVWPVRSSTPPALRLQRVHVAADDDVVGALGRVDRDLHRVRRSCDADAGRHALAGLDRHRERRLVRRLVLRRHQLEAELVAALGRQRQADPAAAPARVMKLIASGVTNWAAMTRSPSFSRSSSSTTTTILPGGDVLERLLDRSRTATRARAHARPTQLLDVLGQDVDLEVDGRARLAPCRASCARASRG